MIKGGSQQVDDLLVPVSSMSGQELAGFLSRNGLSLKHEEVKLVSQKLGRDPTLTELHIFNTQWSEHSSYKSSRRILKKHLPTEGKNVILGPVEDSGIIELGSFNGERYGIVVSHESHNHPSQVVPYEGAATGVGGILRDVLCMGASILATADMLRFGNPYGRNSARTRYIANSVVDGIAGYGNAVGIPVLAGDCYFNGSFDDNCIVNVACLGLVRERDIIHSKAPEGAAGWDIVLVGKATDNSGFGGAAFASLILDEDDAQANKGAVQVPDPFLKNMLMHATEAVFGRIRSERIRGKGISIGFKDLGAGGIMCATSELVDAGSFGADIDLDNVPVSMKDMPPYVIACSETQERLCFISPPELTGELLRIYNKDFDLPSIAEGAQAVVIGKVTGDKSYVMRHEGRLVCSAPVSEVTRGVSYDRQAKPPKERAQPLTEEEQKRVALPKEPEARNKAFLRLLGHPNIASRKKIYKHYDTSVRGSTKIAAGEADAGLLAPLRGSCLGVALSTDANPRYSRIDPYLGAVNAVLEAARNVASIGAVPSALTDCLNYGNPEKPESFWQFVQGVKGIGDAARALHYYHERKAKQPLPIVSGNVSFYNDSAKGNPVDPSPVIACIGTMQDYSLAVTTGLKKEGSALYLIGKRRDELGGSAYHDMHAVLGNSVPRPALEDERKSMYAVIEAIGAGAVLACHDISDGGLAVCVAEMVMTGKAGAGLSLPATCYASPLAALYGESSGYVLEVPADRILAFERVLEQNGLDKDSDYFIIGKTIEDGLKLEIGHDSFLALDTKEMRRAWESGLQDAME